MNIRFDNREPFRLKGKITEDFGGAFFYIESEEEINVFYGDYLFYKGKIIVIDNRQNNNPINEFIDGFFIIVSIQDDGSKKSVIIKEINLVKEL